jgi:poly(A) polymerase
MESVADAMDRLRDLATRPAVAELAGIFAAAGHELALVGGTVRDAFLGRALSGDDIDLDFTTDATPDQTEALLAPLGKTLWDTGRRFGTIGVRIRGYVCEITTYRSDSYDGTSRKPEVQFGTSLEADLTRRDFTVNAMALRVPELVLLDPTGGFDDLLAGRLRTPGAPEVSFGDDPLRMLRGARFRSQLGFDLDPETFAAAHRMAATIEIVAAERIQQEIAKLLLTDDPSAGLRVLVDTGLADHVLPEVPALRLEIDEHARHKDVYEHTLTALDRAIVLEGERGLAPDLILRLAVLLHDIGKPATREIEPGGGVTFHHHDVLGARLATKRLKALRFDKVTIEAVAALIRLHLRFFGYAEGAWTDSAVRRYVRDAGEQLERLHILSRADVTTRNQRKADRLSHAYDDLEARIAALAEDEELGRLRPDLDGEAIMRILGLKPGPAVGEAYRFLMEARLDSGPLGAEEAERLLRRWWDERAG